jgi:hypothetical protein
VLFRSSAAKAAIAKGQMNESIQLTESQLYLMIGKIVERQRKLDEGIMDTFKGAAGKAVDWAKTKGTNLTTKITADKLLQAWKKADSPMDSLDVAKVIQNAGVPSAIIKQVYNNMRIPFAGEPGAQPTTTATATATAPTATAPAAPRSTATATAPTATAPAPAAPRSTATAPTATAPALAGFNAGNVMKLPGMEKYAKPATAVAPKTANFAAGPTGYAKTTYSVKPPTVKNNQEKRTAAALTTLEEQRAIKRALLKKILKG